MWSTGLLSELEKNSPGARATRCGLIQSLKWELVFAAALQPFADCFLCGLIVGSLRAGSCIFLGVAALVALGSVFLY